jgi:aspartyl protease family protein
MGMQDRDWYRDLQKERARKQNSQPFRAMGKPSGLTRGLKMAPFGIIVFWAVVMGSLYFAMNHYLKPRQAVVSSNGDLVIPRARDGHFYAKGQINGQPVNFLVDTGASLVTVSHQFARKASIPRGEPTVFKTANGDLSGRIVSGVAVSVGPMAVSRVRLGVGLEGQDEDAALLGQSFLSKFDVVLQKNQMILRPR